MGEPKGLLGKAGAPSGEEQCVLSFVPQMLSISCAQGKRTGLPKQDRSSFSIVPYGTAYDYSVTPILPLKLLPFLQADYSSIYSTISLKLTFFFKCKCQPKCYP